MSSSVTITHILLCGHEVDTVAPICSLKNGQAFVQNKTDTSPIILVHGLNYRSPITHIRIKSLKSGKVVANAW